MIRAHIIGTGSYLPERVVSNDDLAKVVDTNDEWIVRRTGIRTRHIAAQGEQTSDMAVAAARRALEMADTSPESIDIIVVGTITPDTPMPACAAYVQQKLGATRAFAFDISAACAGSLFAMDIGAQYIASGRAKRVLVIGAEMLSRVTNWSDRNTCVLFGDGAGALVMAPSRDPDRGLLSTHLHTDGSLTELLIIEGGGTKIPPSVEMLEKKLNTIAMRGRDVYKVALRYLTEAMQEALAHNHLTVEQIDHVICHQANARIIEGVQERLGIPKERVWRNIEHSGNISSASLPVSLDEARRAGVLKEGQIIGMIALGSGISWGSAILRW